MKRIAAICGVVALVAMLCVLLVPMALGNTPVEPVAAEIFADGSEALRIEDVQELAAALSAGEAQDQAVDTIHRGYIEIEDDAGGYQVYELLQDQSGRYYSRAADTLLLLDEAFALPQGGGWSGGLPLLNAGDQRESTPPVEYALSYLWADGHAYAVEGDPSAEGTASANDEQPGEASPSCVEASRQMDVTIREARAITFGVESFSVIRYHIDGDTGRVAAESLEIAPVGYDVQITKDGVLLDSFATADPVEFLPSSNGSYFLTIKARFADGLLEGEAVYGAAVKCIAYPGLTVNKAEFYQGEVISLSLVNIEPSVEAVIETDMFVSWTPSFFESDGVLETIIPVSYNAPLGDFTLTVTAGDYSETVPITVLYTEFVVQYLEVDEETVAQTYSNAQADAEYNAAIDPIRTVMLPEKRWDDVFMWPVNSDEITTTFGEIRYVNGGASSSRHGAIDLAVPRGTPVAATHNGQVLYAGYLQMTGYTVIIEHGYGLKSWYYHMDSLNVETGQDVLKGDQIGEVGSTGFSTGPHMHYGLSINGTFINPTDNGGLFTLEPAAINEY